MDIVQKGLGEISPYENNPRVNDEAVDAVAASIKEFGFKVPIVIDGSGVIVAGHTRYRAAKKLGMEAVPCIVADDLSEEQIRAFRLADNKTAELADWNEDLLAQELAAQDPRVVLNFKWHLLGTQETSCVASWAQIALNERGEVMYCCHKPYQVIGHVLDEDILEKKAAAVTDMRTCDIPCRMTAPNAFVARTMAERKDVCFI